MDNTRRRRMFSTFLEYSQMSGVFYLSVIHGLRLLHLLYDIEIRWRKIIKHALIFYVLYSDKNMGF